VIVPGTGIAQRVPLGVVLTCIVAHLEGVVLRRHAEGDGETTAQKPEVIVTEGIHVVESEETILPDNGFVKESRMIVGQQVIESLIDVTDGIFQQIIILDALIDKSL
jgi:hypothetical protein